MIMICVFVKYINKKVRLKNNFVKTTLNKLLSTFSDFKELCPLVISFLEVAFLVTHTFNKMPVVYVRRSRITNEASCRQCDAIWFCKVNI